MPRQAGTFTENTFVKGLITEATGLNFPEQAVTQTDNCVFDEKGTVSRRLGFDFEFGYQTTNNGDTRAITTYRWDAAAGDGDISLLVMQIASTLYFYETDDGAVSDDLVDTLDLSPFKPSGSSLLVGDFECQYASGKGYLFVANPAMESIYVSYDPDARTVSATAITLQIRDFEGVDDGLEVYDRPSVLSDAHEYNVLNQGWDVDQLDLSGGGSDQPLDNWDSARGDFPSNADVWWLYMVSDGLDFNHQKHNRANTPAPKGHFILSYYDQERNGLDTISGRVIENLTGHRTSGDYRASTIEFFAGRVWYAGTRGSGFANEILFSQIIERDSQIGQCHQVNDPACEDVFDLLPSDGGVILIPDSGTVVRLFAFEDSILIFSTNGVWKVSGSEGIGFRANDYSVVKVSSIPVLTASSFVSIAGVPSFWNNEGIYTMTSDSTSGIPVVTSITDNTIKEFFDEIPIESRRYAKGAYNRFTRVLTWVYSSAAPVSFRQRYSYDKILCFNTMSNAFYGWSVDDSDVTINSVVVCMSAEAVSTPAIVTNSALATVIDASLDTVYAYGVTETIAADVTKFLVSVSDGAGSFNWTFAEPWNTSYLDWYVFDETGVSYESSFTTGYKVHGDGQRRVSPTYINLFFDTSDEDSSIDFRSIWKYANSGSTGKWSSAQRVTTTSNLFDYTRRRIKSRGSGEVYQFKVTSVEGEAFNLIGWSVFETSNASV